jgi:hypothetical protein
MEGFEHHSENVPHELKTGSDSWVCCDEFKVPLVATASGAIYAASSTDESTWRDYETAYGAWLENEWSFAGLGRVFRTGEELVGIDIDKCIDETTGEVTPWALEIIETLNSYSEISPSGRGIKVWVYAPSVNRAHVKPGLEIYPHRRYFTVTGKRFRGEGIARRDDELVNVIAQEFSKVDRDRTPYNGPRQAIDLFDYLNRAEVEIFEERSDGAAERKYGIRCPWVEDHTNGGESGTYAGQYADGATFFQCWHAHCTDRRWREFRAHADAIIYGGRPRKFAGRLR